MKKYLITGLIILLPLALTIMIVSFIFNLLTDPFVGYIKWIFSYFGVFQSGFWFLTSDEIQRFIGKFIILIFLIIFTILLGALTRWFLILYLLKFWDFILHRIPFVSSIYKVSQDVINTIFSSDTKSFKQVVLIHFPSMESHCIGLVARDDLAPVTHSSEETLVAVFVPTAPNPTSGYLFICEKKNLVYLDMKVEDAFKCIISCGVISKNFKLPSQNHNEQA